MKRILVTGAGGSASTNFIRSLRNAPEDFYIVGTDCDKYYLMRSEADRNYLVPKVSELDFLRVINFILKKEKIEFVHPQTDVEVKFFSENREKIKATTFLPSKQTVNICQDKFTSYEVWKAANLKVPLTMEVNKPTDLKRAFERFGGRIWLRAKTGAGGRWSLPASDYKVARSWIEFHKGWGEFCASELLEPQSITWMSIWNKGELVVAQGRKRLYWELAKIAPSGISGVTGASLTIRDKILDEIALKAIKTLDDNPNGLFGVDLTYDEEGIPNPTEINIGRFFTTIHFFTEAGLNMPYLYTKLAYGENLPTLKTKINPLKPGVVWIRGVDFEPILVADKEIDKHKLELAKIRKTIKR